MAQESTPTVFCKGLTKSYFTGGMETKALQGIDLSVFPNELMMLVGPSGCGKTTLISVIAGILNHDQGECRVLGENIRALSDRARTQWRGHNIGFVFQSFNLIPTLSAQENAAVPLLIQGTPRDEALERSAALLTHVGLNDKLRSRPNDLSGGQQQRVAIARALVHNPKLVVCDEPTSALDFHTGETVMELLRQVAVGDGRSLVIVTHDARIFPYADRMAMMNDGVIDQLVTDPKSYQH